MTDPRTLSERVIAAIMAQLATITTSNGYRTNAGLLVERAVRTIPLSDSQPTGFVVWDLGESTDEGDGQHRSMMVRLKIGVDFATFADQDETGQRLQDGKADFKRCVLDWAWARGVVDSEGNIGPLAYNGASTSARQDGSDAELVSFELVASYKEGFGNPFSHGR